MEAPRGGCSCRSLAPNRSCSLLIPSTGFQRAMATTDTPQRDMDPEKQPLLIPIVFEAPHQQPFAYTPFLFRLLAFYVLASVILSPTTRNGVHSSIAALSTFGGGGGDAVVCQQYGALVPSRDEGLEGNKAKIFSEEYRTKSAGILGGLVQVQ